MFINGNNKTLGKKIYKITYISTIIKLIPIPFGLLNAKLIADIVTSANVGDVNKVIYMSALLLTIILLIKFLQILLEIAFEKMSAKTVHDCKIHFYKTLLSNPLWVLYETNMGNIFENIDKDFETILDKYRKFYPNLITGSITALVYSIFIGVQNINIIIAMILISLLQIIPPIIIKKFMKINYENLREVEAHLTTFIMEGYHGFASIKLYNLKKWWISQVAMIHKKYADIGTKSTITYAAESAMGNFLDNILKYGTCGIIGVLVLFQFASLEIGIQSISLSGGFYEAIKTMLLLIPEFAVAKSAESRLIHWFYNRESSDTKLIRSSKVDIRNLSYRYENSDQYIFQNLNIKVDTTKICILKGLNGKGKSTFLKLILGLLKADNCIIKTGGIFPLCLSENNFPKKIFYLPQNDMEFEISPQELFEIVANETLLKKINEYEIDFGLNPNIINHLYINRLSGGERKKVFLSLALAINPEMLLLDEPTNSLDAESKLVLCNKLKNRKNGALIITHDKIFNCVAEAVYHLDEGNIFYEEA